MKFQIQTPIHKAMLKQMHTKAMQVIIRNVEIQVKDRKNHQVFS